MKKMLSFLVPFFLCLSFSMASCVAEDEAPVFCDEVHGYVIVKNTSANTVQQILIDGIEYAVLYPGDQEKITLAPGKYEIEANGISGGGGCYSGFLTIVKCEVHDYQCSG
jgi:hypothetical protein